MPSERAKRRTGEVVWPPIPATADRRHLRILTQEILAREYPGVPAIQVLRDPDAVALVDQLVRERFWSGRIAVRPFEKMPGPSVAATVLPEPQTVDERFEEIARQSGLTVPPTASAPTMAAPPDLLAQFEDIARRSQFESPEKPTLIAASAPTVDEPRARVARGASGSWEAEPRVEPSRPAPPRRA